MRLLKSFLICAAFASVVAATSVNAYVVFNPDGSINVGK